MINDFFALLNRASRPANKIGFGSRGMPIVNLGGWGCSIGWYGMVWEPLVLAFAFQAALPWVVIHKCRYGGGMVEVVIRLAKDQWVRKILKLRSPKS